MIATLVFGLFVSAFTAATLLPGSSEAALVGILASGKISTGLAIAVATIGNTLGSCVNWWLGTMSARFKDRNWFPLKPEKFDQVSQWYNKWRLWSLLASWVPIIGDPLTVIAGVARTPFLVFVSVVAIAKLARYLAVAGTFAAFW